MQHLFVLFAVVAVASASSLLGAAPLLPKVEVGPTQVNVVRQQYTVEEPVPVHRSVPVPVKAVTHTAPIVESPVVAAPWAYAAAAPAVAAPWAYAAAAPAVAAPLAYAAAPAHYGYAASHLGYAAPAWAARTIAAPGVLAHSTILAH